MTGLRPLLRGDAERATGAAAIACAAMAAIEYPATLLAAPSGTGIGTALRLLLLDVTLFAIFFLVLAPVFAIVAASARLALAAASSSRARVWRGLFAAAEQSPREPSRAAALAWGIAIAAAVFVAASAAMTFTFTARFKAPEVTALALSLIQLVIAAVAAGIGALCVLALRPLARTLHPLLGRASPVGSAPVAIAAMLALALVAIRIAVVVIPPLEPLVPWRHMVAALVLLVGVHAHSLILARRGSLLPVEPRRRRLAVLAIAAAAVVIVPATLVGFGAHPATKTTAVSSSPPLASLVGLVRRGNDFDRDGYGFLLGENDCDPFDSAIHPLARDIPDNGIDENCNGRDFALGALPSYRSGERMPVPEAYQQDWNFLLLTVDTVRYDHTGFGGYERDTTPNLDALVDRSVSFDFCNAPSAGTMASVPAIITSRFFHSGIALDENVKKRMPPKLKPQNTLISEVMKRDDYRTGAIVSHYYFNDWGMEQGFDTYDNTLGAKDNPRGITSDKLTDRALAWIGDQGQRKWFLWVHYLDPHGYYVAHPDEHSYGTTEMDLYDGELRYTDRHVGRLLRELARLPGGDRTVVIVTSDHGDGFNEHGFINHGQALYREILHVPLIIYVPNNEPRVAGGAVSPLDILPTMADLTGIDISDLTIEGESLVPHLFYGHDLHDRVVFAETNYRNTLRAAVTSSYKLVYNIEANVYELYDLNKDPWEKKNLRSANIKAFEQMKGYLDDWLERVYYSRDPDANQVMFKLRDVIVRGEPRPQHPVDGVAFDDGRIAVIGWDSDKDAGQPGQPLEISVYLRAADRPSADFKLQIEAWWPTGPASAHPGRSKLRIPGDGLFPSGRWRPGEIVRDRFKVTVPPSWNVDKPARLAIGLKLTPAHGTGKVSVRGKTRPDDPDIAVLGELTLQPAPPPLPNVLKPGTPAQPTPPGQRPRGSRGPPRP